MQAEYITGSQNCVFGNEDQLYPRLKVAIDKYERIDIIVAFLMESGVKMLVEDFREAIQRGASIRILCGNYLNITQPQSLYLLRMELGDNIDLRFYKDNSRSFHPKAYIFEKQEKGEIFIGSSNMSKSALTRGIEWNYRIEKENNPIDFKRIKDEFQELFLNQSILIDDNILRQYSKAWKKPKINVTYAFEDKEYGHEVEGIDPSEGLQRIAEKDSIVNLFQPRGAQIEALYELKKSRTEGWDKGLVVAATGIGKTYLAAFDSVEYKRILFVAHREEILRQAEQSFQNVRPELTTGFFTGECQETEKDIIFATVQTLGKMTRLSEGHFSPSRFDYIIVDEFHHATAGNYGNILEYFQPKFLLGLTATPERMDNEDVFALCDYNVIYDVRLKEAINKGWLVPFRYYGIYDSTNYDGISYRNGKYDLNQIEKALTQAERSRLVLEHFRKYNSSCTLGFCASVRHAVFMAKFFSENGIIASAVVSDSSGLPEAEQKYIVDRVSGIQSLRIGETKVVFSVDMFNEGLDVPEVDMVLFLRPTESPTVFLQQLGRGLRKHRGKSYVNVLDFIGNYKKANVIPLLLAGNSDTYEKSRNREGLAKLLENDLPEDCLADFDFRLIDLFERMEAQRKAVYDRILETFYRVKEEKGRKPTRLELYTALEEELLQRDRTTKNSKVFSDFLGFLLKIEEATAVEKSLTETLAHEFFKKIESTSMSKTYKMPLLRAFYQNGTLRKYATWEDIAKSFREFYSHGVYRVDLLRHKETEDFEQWEDKNFIHLAMKNPVNFLLQSCGEFFYKDAGGFGLSSSLDEFINNSAFQEHFLDIIHYRARRFARERLEHENRI